ncbi:MAG: glycerate kinase type-2 family protein [Anaerolineae bacterium]
MTQREGLDRIREAALNAVDPGAAVSRHLAYDKQSERLFMEGRHWDLHASGRLLAVSVGKAAAAMAEAVDDIVGARLSQGIVVTKYEHAAGHRLSGTWDVVEAGHPIPDQAGLSGSRAIIEMLDTTSEEDFVLVLLSGGGSALMPAPVSGISLDALQTTTDLLLRVGANIVEINTVRKHLSRLKGGQLARWAAPAPVVAMVLSDVVGDPLDVIASGPTSPDPTTYADAIAVLERYALLDEVQSPVVDYLDAGKTGDYRETPKPGDEVFEGVSNVIVGSNHLAAVAAVAEADRLGYHALLLTTFVEGEAREVAKVASALAKGVIAHENPIARPACLVWGGETTVTVRGTGKGGRNQELALAATLGLASLDDVLLMALATDGTDGPTDAAGAVVDGSTAARARELGWDIRSTLDDNNSYPLLADVGALLLLGPTGTNVNDLLVLLIGTP